MLVQLQTRAFTRTCYKVYIGRGNGALIAADRWHRFQGFRTQAGSRKRKSIGSLGTRRDTKDPVLVARTPARTCKFSSVVAGGEQPSRRQLRILALRSGIPMVGFGFMDNLVMIQAGDFIDTNLGVTFALSTLTAAGFGQIFSDVAGITCGGLVDAAVSKLNLPDHGLSRPQLMLRVSRTYSTLGGIVGVVIGCLLGMSCLLLMDTRKAERLKQARELTTIFKTMAKEGNDLISCERATIWLLDEEREEIWSMVSTNLEGEIRVAHNKGIVGECIKSGETVNIADAYQDERFNRSVDKLTGYRTRSIVCVPVKNGQGNVIGAIQMIVSKECCCMFNMTGVLQNKKIEGESGDGEFDENDIKLLKMLSSHVSTFIEMVST